MAKYFNFFPKTVYAPNGEMESLDVLTNLTARFSFEQKFKDNSSLYYKYDIRDGDTPEILASKLYDSTEKHWIIMMMNDIVDPFYDWPLNQSDIIKFIDSKYTSSANVGETGLSWASSHTHSYYKIETQTVSSTDFVTVTNYEIDATAYDNLATSTSTYTLNDGNEITITISKEMKTYYEYEIDVNEAKRTIKVLKPELVPAVEKEFKRVLNDNLR